MFKLRAGAKIRQTERVNDKNPFTLSEGSSGSSRISRAKKDFGSRLNVVFVVKKRVPPTFNFTQLLDLFSPSFSLLSAIFSIFSPGGSLQLIVVTCAWSLASPAQPSKQPASSGLSWKMCNFSDMFGLDMTVSLRYLSCLAQHISST